MRIRPDLLMFIASFVGLWLYSRWLWVAAYRSRKSATGSEPPDAGVEIEVILPEKAGSPGNNHLPEDLLPVDKLVGSNRR
jgi:hypothetical protein